jgi:hypothetical protein
VSQSDFAFEFKAFDAEEFFVKRLRDHRRTIHAGVTDTVTRKERIRAAILDGHLDCAIIGRHGGKSETYSQCFARHYGEPLQPKRKATA